MQVFKRFSLFIVQNTFIIMVWLECFRFVNRFKNQANIDGKDYEACLDAALVEVFIITHIVNSTLIMQCFILICSVEALSMCTINASVHRVCRIKFTQSFGRLIKCHVLWVNNNSTGCTWFKMTDDYWFGWFDRVLRYTSNFSAIKRRD